MTLDKLIQKAIAETVTEGLHVEYSVSASLAGIPILGKIKFVIRWGERIRDYESPIVESPTWLEIIFLANEMIKTTGDFDHIYLEGVELVKDEKHKPIEENEVRIATFIMGS